MIYFDSDNPPSIPLDVAKCPICGSEIKFVEINEYETETGKVVDTGFHVGCITEPDFDDPDYDDWLNGHYSMPYVDWLPVEIIVYRWLSANYRLRLPNNQFQPTGGILPVNGNLLTSEGDPALEVQPGPPPVG